jgi:uncharacterized membrane protein
MASDNMVRLAAVLIGAHLLIALTFVLLALGVINGSVILGGVVLIVMAIAAVLLSGRGGWLIAGYNTMSAEEKARYDEKGLSRAVGGMMLVVGILIAVSFIAKQNEMDWLFTLSIVLYVVVLLAGVIWINTGERYRRHDA